jgi:hypothetical protein
MSSNEEKLTHLEHAEDHVINAGSDGFHHAYNTLVGVHNALRGQKSDVQITTKYDGSPSLVFGYHPVSGKFFVGSKSVFNKNPKINFSPEDIEANHGHAPGLASKLKSALRHLPKVTPKGRIFQGDIMHTPEDVTMSGGSYHFKPNTITYSTKTDSEQGKKLQNSKIGVAVHTEYTGKSFDNMKAKYGASTKDFTNHKDVHVIDTHLKLDKGHHTPEAHSAFIGHLNNAVDSHNQGTGYDHLENHREHLKHYINTTVREGKSPSVKGYQDHLKFLGARDMISVKTEKAQEAKRLKWASLHDHVSQNKEAFKNTLDTHKHLQQAKNVLENSLSSHQDFHHSIDGKQTKPEGFVAILNNRPTKIVDRSEFSRANFLMSQNR